MAMQAHKWIRRRLTARRRGASRPHGGYRRIRSTSGISHGCREASEPPADESPESILAPRNPRIRARRSSSPGKSPGRPDLGADQDSQLANGRGT